MTTAASIGAAACPGDDPAIPNEAHFDKAIALYREIGFSPERTVVQLARAGHPRERIRSRFPDVAESAYPEPTPTRAALRASQRAHRGAAAGPLLNVPTAGGLLTKLALPRAPVAVLPSAAPGLTVSEPALSFQYVPLIQCSFPHADPGDATAFSRRNGWLELTLSTARADTGLPYGVPARLLTIYCASEAIRTRSPEIYLGTSVHDFLRQLDVPITRGERGSLRVYANQLLRLIHCALSIDENIRDAQGRTGLHIRQALFAEEARLWWDQASGVGRGSSLVLSPVLFQSILERSAPLSTLAVKQLRKSPMDLDVTLGSSIACST